jgi:formylglycine-generating enzyme required for sulfatase activity
MLFLLGQRLSQLTGVEDPVERRFHVCGGVSAEPLPQRKPAERDLWEGLDRPVLREKAIGHTPHRRVALVCDAGLGKTTNMQWLAAGIAGERGGRQLPLLLRLDDSNHLDLLEQEHAKPNALLDWLAAEVARQAGGDPLRHRRALDRLQAGGRITLLIDGLDHALARPAVPGMLPRLLGSVQWRGCPVWIAGRPYAFDACWSKLFAQPEWQFLRVEPLAEPEIRFYMTRQAGGDWYDEFPAESGGLLAVPRLLQLICGIIRSAIRGAVSPRDAVRGLDLRTAADVYYRAYFERGQYDDRDSQGLLAQGLVGAAERVGLADGVAPTELNYRERVERTSILLGAIAFQMFAMNSAAERPEPNTSGADLKSIRPGVVERLREAEQGTAAEFERDLNFLRMMNNGALEFLIFREASERRLVFHDRTVQAFFAACWAMRFGTPRDRKAMRRWIVDGKGERLGGFDDFWTFAAELPDLCVDGPRWRKVFGCCYTPPQELHGQDEWVQWHRRMIYHSFRRMQARFPDTVANWRASYCRLARGNPNQQRICREIEDGFRGIPAGVCPYGADPLINRPGTPRPVAAFRMHRWQVTNEMYEEFDPHHRDSRWNDEHPLGNDDRCPVVSVTWYDAWCFAAWCGHRLPTELEWEHACRAGSETAWYFGNDDADLARHAWYWENSRFSTHPVGELAKNTNGLHDLHGNVWEWCEDRYEPGASARVLRGGGWLDDGGYCRSAFRRRLAPEDRDDGIGFRLAAVPAVGAEPGKEV